MKNEKEIAIKTAMDSLNKKYGAGSVLKMSEENAIEIETIPTNCWSLDWVMAAGGLPKGRIIELYGPEGGGKTSLAMYFISQLQKQGKKAMLVDVEFCFSKEYAEQLGVDTKELILSQPSTAEEALEIIDEMVRSNAIDIIVLDSVASLVPRAELEGNIGDNSIALQARLMSRALRILTGNISRTKTIVVFINQLRMKVGVYWGPKEVTPGGKALKFFSSIRIEVKNVKKIKGNNDEIIGNIMGIFISKNKVGMPWRKCELELIYGQGIDAISDLFNVAVKNDVISKSANTYTYGDIKLGVGKNSVIKFLKETLEISKKIKDELSEKENIINDVKQKDMENNEETESLDN